MEEYEYEDEVGYDPEGGTSEGMYMGDAQPTAYDPFATYAAYPMSGMFMNGIGESRS